MPHIGIAAVCLTLPLLCAGEASALTLEWDRNSETDMATYNVYACFTKGCTVTKTAAMKQSPPVAQPPSSTVPSFPLPDGKEGAVAITAVDTSGNESGLSVSVPFDAMAPSVPANPRLK